MEVNWNWLTGTELGINRNNDRNSGHYVVASPPPYGDQLQWCRWWQFFYFAIITNHCIFVQGASKKGGYCFMISISVLNSKLLGIYFIWKIRSIDPSGVQKTFCTISESWYIVQSKYCFAYTSAPWYGTEMLLYSKQS